MVEIDWELSAEITNALRARRRRRATGFSPTVLFAAGEQGAWFDPSDLMTLYQDVGGTVPVTAPGQSVALMLDKSGRGSHASQATAAARPTYQIDASGRGYLAFDGVDDFMVTPSINFTSTDKMTVFAGVRKLSGAAVGMVCELGTDTNTINGSFYVTAPLNTGTGHSGCAARGTATVSVGASGWPAPASGVLTLLADILAPYTKHRRNGSQVAQYLGSVGSGTFASLPLYIGMRAGTSLPFNGNIYGLIARGAASDAVQIANTEAWLNNKTGAY